MDYLNRLCTKILPLFKYLTISNNEFYIISMCMPMYGRVYVQKGYVVNDPVDV